MLSRLDATLKQIKKYPEQWPLEVQKTLPAPWQSAQFCSLFFFVWRGINGYILVMSYEAMSVAYVLFAHVHHICQGFGRASEENRQVVRAVLASHGCFRALARCCQGRGTKDVTWWTFMQILEGNGQDMQRKLYKIDIQIIRLISLISFDTVS